MGLNLALEASNNSQIVFSLREWEKKLRGRKGKKGPRLGQVQQGTAQSYRVEAEGLSLPVLAAVRYQMICRPGSGLAAPLCRILLAAAGRLSSSDPPNGFDSDSTLMLVQYRQLQVSALVLLHGCSMLQHC